MPNHAELVQAAVRWLLKAGGCSIAFSEFATAAIETPDAIGWNCFTSIVIECKATRADFYHDGQKVFRRRPELGMGAQRYYLTPPKLIKPEDMPEKWGLLELHGRRILTRAKPRGFPARSRTDEIKFLVSMLRRAKVRLDPDGNLDTLDRWIKNRREIRIRRSR